jgi:hypothetical protein
LIKTSGVSGGASGGVDLTTNVLMKAPSMLSILGIKISIQFFYDIKDLPAHVVTSQ